MILKNIQFWHQIVKHFFFIFFFEKYEKPLKGQIVMVFSCCGSDKWHLLIKYFGSKGLFSPNFAQMKPKITLKNLYLLNTSETASFVNSWILKIINRVMRRVGLPWWNEISDSHTGQVFIRILTTQYIILYIITFKIRHIFSLANP